MAGLAETKPAKRKRLAASKRGSAKGGVWNKLREAQRKCGCNTRTLKTVLKAVQPFCGSEIGGINVDDEELFEAGEAVVLQLHGCVKCNEFVFSPTNKMLRCPKCQHPRFNQKKKPNEVCCLFCFCFIVYQFCLCCFFVLCCGCRCAGTSRSRISSQHFCGTKNTENYLCTRRDVLQIQLL